MHKRLTTTFLPVALLLTILVASTSATSTVGVKEGDWVEYNVSFSGDASFGHDVTWARIDVARVERTTVAFNITTKATDGTLNMEPQSTINFDTGALIDDFIIPANLGIGDSFYDQSKGNITITNMEKRNIAGAERNVIFGTTADSDYYWDQATGIVVEANSTYPTYTIHTLLNSTNLWQPQSLGFETTMFYAFVAGGAGILAAAVSVVAWRRRKSKN